MTEETSIDYEQVGKRIRKRRLELGLTQERASEKADITARYWSNIETNNTGSIGLKALYKIATALNVNINYLVSGYDEKIVYDKIGSIFNKMTLQQRTLIMDISKLILEKECKDGVANRY